MNDDITMHSYSSLTWWSGINSWESDVRVISMMTSRLSSYGEKKP